MAASEPEQPAQEEWAWLVEEALREIEERSEGALTEKEIKLIEDLVRKPS